MKGLLITAVIVGAGIAGLILYFSNEPKQRPLRGLKGDGGNDIKNLDDFYASNERFGSSIGELA